MIRDLHVGTYLSGVHVLTPSSVRDYSLRLLSRTVVYVVSVVLDQNNGSGSCVRTEIASRESVGRSDLTSGFLSLWEVFASRHEGQSRGGGGVHRRKGSGRVS